MSLSPPPAHPVGVEIRRSGPADLDTLLPLVRQFYRHFGYPYDEPSKRKALCQLWQKPSQGDVWLVLAGERPIGYAVLVFSFSLESNGGTASIDEFFIEPGSRQHGAGTAALGLIENLCRRLDVTAIHLEAEDSNAQATALYLRQGFIDHGRRLLKKRLGAAEPRED